MDGASTIAVAGINTVAQIAVTAVGILRILGGAGTGQRLAGFRAIIIRIANMNKAGIPRGSAADSTVTCLCSVTQISVIACLTVRK